MADSSTWQGRFPYNDIISLLDINRQYNLAESTAQDLTFGEILAMAGESSAINDLKMGYGTSAGLLRLRKNVASLTGVAPEDVLTTQGTALGLFLLALELCRSGDEAVLVTPCFPLAGDSLVGAGARLRECRLSFDQGYKLTAAMLEPLLNERTKLVSIASPQNPNGVRVSAAELKAIVQLVREKSPHAWLFVDETYRDASYGDQATPASVATFDDRIITGASVSKAHGAPGLRVGWLTVRNKALRDRLIVAKMNIVISGSTLDETLAAIVLENSERILSERCSLLAEGLRIVAAWVEANRNYIEWVRPEGGALCAIRLKPAVYDNAGIARFWASLPDADLQIGNGAWFRESSAVLRLGFGYLPIKVLPSALAALSGALERAATVP